MLGEVKKYNLAISVIFENLKLKKYVFLISLIITSLYLLSVGKTLPVIYSCCRLSHVFEAIWLVIFCVTFILKFILVCVNNNIFWQIKFIISTATVEKKSFKRLFFPTTIPNVFFIVAKNIMKCLLSSSSFDNDEELIEHYITYHKIDTNNRCFSEAFSIKQELFSIP